MGQGNGGKLEEWKNIPVEYKNNPSGIKASAFHGTGEHSTG